MKKLCIGLASIVLLIYLSIPAFAQRNVDHHSNDSYKKRDHHSNYQSIKDRIHYLITQHQFSLLKKMYDRSNPEAQQLFLDYIGAESTSNDKQIQALREAYEQQIAELNGTISTMQLQLEALPAQLNAECDARVAQAQEEWQAVIQQDLDALNAAHQGEMENLTVQLNTECEDRLEQAFLDGQASVEPCATDEPPELTAAFNSGDVSPYAIDIDSSGNIFILDRDMRSITELSPSGAQIGEWRPGTLGLPVDIAMDSHNNIYVLDQQAVQPLQKFGQNGAPLALDEGISSILSPLGLYIDSNDIIYVTDRGGDYAARVLKFDTSGTLLGYFEEVVELQWLDFNDIVVDESNQNIYVVTGGFSNMVAKFGMDGSYLGAWEGDFRAANGIAVSADGSIYIADTFNNQIDQYDSDGNLKFTFAEDVYRPYHILTNSTGQLYVADYGNMRIRIYE